MDESRSSLPKTPILKALNEDGSIDFELLKQISLECLKELKARHSQGKFLANFHPDQIFYDVINNKVKIEFAQQIEQAAPTYRMTFLAPEIIQKISKPTADSDIFSLGLVFFYLFTKGESPLMIIMKLSKEVVHHEITIKLRLLDELRTNTDSILFIDLLKRMIEKIPDQRETCAKLIDHAIFMNIENRCEIVRTISNKCFKKDKCINQNLIKIMDQHNLHKEGSLRASWWDFLDEAAKCTSQQPNIEVCSSFVSLFQHIKLIKQLELSNKLLQAITIILPNFFPHLYIIFHDELPKVKDGKFEEIFVHFNDAENSLGTGSNHTNVYKGKYGQRPIAIKKVSRKALKTDKNDISLILQSDLHANVLKFFGLEEDNEFIYIGMELCECNLGTFIKNQDLRQKLATKTIFQQTVKGLNYLHQLSIIHRDVKPRNILISKNNGMYSVRIADFGISQSKKLAYIAPEVQQSPNCHDQLSDIFSLGCVFYFVFFNGSTLWNDCLKDFVKAETKLKEKLQGMIAANNKYKNLNQEFLQMDLLMKILKVDPKLRPSTQEILQHSVFWDDKKSLEFILEIRKKLDVIKYSYLNGIKSEYVKLLKRIQIELKYLDKKFESLLKKDLKHKKAFGDLTNKITLLNKRLVKPNLEDECKKAWHKILDEVKNKMNDLDDVFKEDHHKKIKNFFENLITKVGQKSFSDQQKVLQDIQNEITKVMKDIGLNLHQPFKSFVTGVPTIRNNSMCHQKILEDLLGLTISLEQNQKKKKEEYQNVLERVKKAIEAIEPEFIYDDQRAASQGIQSKVEVLDPAFIVKIKNDYAIIGQAIREAVSTVDPMFEINNEPFIKEMKDIFNIFDDKKELKVTDEQLDVVTLGELVKCLDESPELDQIKNWKIQVNKDLVEELKGPHQENVSDLLRAMRNKWMHKEESGKDVKALFGEGTAREYLDYFTFLFPRLLLHCYSTVESKAKEQFAEYFGQYQKPTAEKDTPGVDLQGPQMIINFKDVITLPETKVNALKICDISHIFFVDNKHFLNYLLNNGTNVTQLEFSDGSLKFDSVNMILQALPNLIKIAFYRVHYVAPKTNQTIQTETCKKLLELEIYSLKSSNLLPAFFECTTIKKLRVDNPTVTLEEILQRYPKLEELKVELNKEYPVSNGGHLVQNILQLSVLQLGLGDIDDDCIDEIIETLLTFIQHQNELQEFSFITYNNNSFNHFQSFRAELVAHISKLASLTRLEIEGDVLLDGTGLVSFLNTSKLTSIKVRNLKTVSNFRSLNVVTLKVLHIQVNSQLKPYDIFSDLQVILKKHPKIIDLKIELKDSEVKLSFLELIEKLLHFGGLKRFEILSNKYGLRAEDICHLKALNNLQYWKINEHVNLTEVAP